MATQRKTAADYGQLSLFEETVPAWLQPDESSPGDDAEPAVVATDLDEDDDLGQFTSWLQQSGKQTTSM